MTGELLGIIKVSEAASCYDECSSKGDAYPFYGCEQIHLLLILRAGKIGKILFEILNLLLKESYGFLDGLSALGIEERQCLHRALEVPCGNKLFLELANDCTLLLQGENGVAAELVRHWLHLLTIESNQAGIYLIRLNGG